MRALCLLLVLVAVPQVASAQTIGFTITAATGKMAPFSGQTLRASMFPQPNGGQQFVAATGFVDGNKMLTIAYDDLPSDPVPRQVIRVFLTEYRQGMACTCSARLPLGGGTAATIGGGGNTTLVGMGSGIADGGQITLAVTP